MSCNLVILPTERGVGSFAIRLGMRHALERNGYTVRNFHPLRDSGITNQQLQNYFLNNRTQDLLEEIIKAFDQVQEAADFVLVEGIYYQLGDNHELAWFNNHVEWFNNALLRAVNGHAIIVTRPTSDELAQLEEKINLAIRNLSPELVLGVIVSKLGAPLAANGAIKFSLLDEDDHASLRLSHAEIAASNLFNPGNLKLIATTQWNKELVQPRIVDIMRALNIQPLTNSPTANRRVKRISLCSRSINNLISDLQAGTLIVTAVDRADVIMAAALAEAKGIKLAGLLLTGNYTIPHATLQFCYPDHKNQLAIYANQDERKTVSIIMAMKDLELKGVPADDYERLHLIKQEISERIDIGPLEAKLKHQVTKKMSPAAFRYMLIKKASSQRKRIVLPEGEELRTLTAAIYCQDKGIAECVLLGNPHKIKLLAQANGLNLPTTLQIIDQSQVASNYVAQLVKLRQHKGMTPELALDLLSNDVNLLGTMMLYNNEVHGLVSGAENTTAATVRPALQIIKTKPDASIVSSVFFMCLEDQVLVYGDCAINPNPNAEQLADIAIQSADTAKQFNIEPRVAMISYSTGSSGSGEAVNKVATATQIVKCKRPDILIDGPLQYDAAMIKEVAAKKAPNSQVAGRATVCIFPDLNTGNTTYKAVQRSANVLSIGPLLQSLNKPVNDLSRGATVDDIIYTIAITAVQS